MKFEVAVALNYWLHLKLQVKNEGRLFTQQQARMIRYAFAQYFAHNASPMHSQVNSIYNSIRSESLPYPVDSPTIYVNHVAIQVDDKLLLLYWHTNSSTRKEWKSKILNLEKLDITDYNFTDGVHISFETCAVSFRNIAYLKVLGWHVFTDYKRINALPDIPRGELDSRLFPYQVEGVRMLEAGYRLMADEQGLGKTAQVLQFIQRTGLRRILICCPATLKLNWRKEILMWTQAKPSDITIISGTSPYKIDTKYTIVNYDLLTYWADYLKDFRWGMVVADECHYIQSDKAQRTQAFTTIVEKAQDAIYISGTPFTSRPIQMYTALHNIAPDIFRTQQEFGNRFCDPKYVRNQVTYKGATNMDVLHDILKDGICIRRLKEDVLKDLPDKMRVTIPVGMSKEEVKNCPDIYSQIMELEDKIAQTTDLLGTLEWQKQICYLRKKKDIITWISDFLETGKKLVVFAVHKMTIEDIMSAFPHISVKLDGSSSQKEREQAIERFQNDPNTRLFVGNVKAAGTGITLTAASDVLTVEFGWVCSEHLQAEDRCHRIGAKNAVTAYYMVCPDSIDEHLVDIINYKADVHKRIFDGESDNMLETLKKKGGVKYNSLFHRVN